MNLDKIQKNLEELENISLINRRDTLSKVGEIGLKVAAAAIPFSLMSNRKTFAQSGGNIVVDTLNFALTLEYLEAEFYDKGLNQNMSLIPSSDRTIFTQIGKHENAHVTALKATIQQLGGTPVNKPTFDFTAGGTYADVFTNYQTFLVLAQAFEDTGVRAYKGQAGNLISNDAVLTAALQIHSVEARHASEVRRLRGLKGWIPNAETGGAPQPVYAGEANTTQGGVNVSTVTQVSQSSITEAFDEILTKDEVLAIAGPFIQ